MSDLTEEELDWLSRTYPDDDALFDDTSTDDELVETGFESFLVFSDGGA